MKIIKAGYEILTPISDGGLEELKKIEMVARICYKSEGKITEDGESAKKLVKHLIKFGHEAMLEHVSITVKFIVDRGVSHEIVRHRLASYAQESTRYCKYDNEITVIDLEPSFEYTTVPYSKKDTIIAEWYNALLYSQMYYKTLINNGASAQTARSVLPNSIKTELVMTANLREWRHFLKLRTDESAHPQIREVAIPLLSEFKEKLPIIFDDLNV